MILLAEVGDQVWLSLIALGMAVVGLIQAWQKYTSDRRLDKLAADAKAAEAIRIKEAQVAAEKVEVVRTDLNKKDKKDDAKADKVDAKLEVIVKTGFINHALLNSGLEAILKEKAVTAMRLALKEPRDPEDMKEALVADKLWKEHVDKTAEAKAVKDEEDAAKGKI